MEKVKKFLYSAAAVGLAWWINGWFTSYGIFNWYAQFEKPTITPPDSAFPIIWSILYVLMIIAFYMVLMKADRSSGRRVNQLFIGQLVLQIIWTYLFFAMGHIGLAFGVIILLDLVVFKMIMAFKGLDARAAYLMYPYFWWLIYASFLNFSFIYIAGMTVVF